MDDFASAEFLEAVRGVKWAEADVERWLGAVDGVGDEERQAAKEAKAMLLACGGEGGQGEGG